jgi:hypothetical protein
MSSPGLAGLTLIALAFLTHGAPTLSWTNTLLTMRDARLPGGKLEVWSLEAFCRPGGHDRNWDLTKVPHETKLIFAAPDGSELRFRTTVEPQVEILHEVRASEDGLDFTFLLTNHGERHWDIQWFQPACIRVSDFTGRDQQGYGARSFVFTTNGLTPLNQIDRSTNALYPDGQVYLPPHIRSEDANPRPRARSRVTSGLIGCFSADDRWLLATASDRTFELFEGVYVCLHSDPLIAGLNPGETKRRRQKLYLLPNDPAALVRRYRADFPDSTHQW